MGQANAISPTSMESSFSRLANVTALSFLQHFDSVGRATGTTSSLSKTSSILSTKVLFLDTQLKLEYGNSRKEDWLIKTESVVLKNKKVWLSLKVSYTNIKLL